MDFMRRLGGRGKEPAPPAAIPGNRFRPDPAFGDPEARALVERLASPSWAEVPGLLAAQTDLRRRNFLVRVLGTAFRGRPEPIDAWPRQQPENGLAWLLRGVQGIDWAWEARGHARASQTSEDRFEAFHDRLLVARDDLTRAAGLLPDDPMPWAAMVTVAMGLGATPEIRWQVFERARALDPWQPDAHIAMARALCGKWGGSDQAMYRFVRDALRDAPDGDPVHATIVTAHWEAALDHGTPSAYFADPVIADELRDAAARSIDRRPGERDPWLMRARADFAFGFLLTGDRPRLRAQLEVLDDAICGLWLRVPQPVEAFRAARRDAGLPLA
jgi:hypothetical protein